MCAVCRQNPCDYRCPNAEPPKPVMMCELCGDPIFQGDKYFDNDGDGICECCMEEMTTSEVLELFGEKMSIAKEDE